MARRPISIRWSLLGAFLVLIVLLGGSIFWLLISSLRTAVGTLSENLVRRTVDRMEADLGAFFEPVASHLQVAKGWADRGLIRCTETACVNQMFQPIMEASPQIDSVNTGDDSGAGVLLMRTEDGWHNRVVSVDAWGRRGLLIEHDASHQIVSERWDDDLGYDPRTRPWFVEAAAPDATVVRWTEPYVFFTSKLPGITASVRTRDAEGREFVLALDVRLDAITAFTQRLDAGASGLVFVITDEAEDPRVVGLPRHEDFDEEEERQRAALIKLSEIDIPVLNAARVRADAARPSRPLVGREHFTVPFVHEGEVWWGTVRRLRAEDAPPLLIGAVVPERDFLRDVKRMRERILWATLATLAGAVLLALWQARSYSKPLRALVAQSDRLRNLDTGDASEVRTRLSEVRRLSDAHERMRGALDSFARYVPVDVVRDLLDRGEAAQIGGRSVEVTALFTDIRGFTSIAERMDPTRLTAHMGEYFDVVLSTLSAHGATIDKLVGDAIVAFWGAPAPEAKHAARAMEGVLACLSAMAELEARWREEGRPLMPTRFGLATGPVVVGNVGSPMRLHYTALGDTMNLASRLESLNERYGTTVLAVEHTVVAAGEAFAWRRLDRIAVKGRESAVDVFELIGRAADLDDGLRARIARYEEGLRAFQAGRFDDAMATLEPIRGDDPPSARLWARCRELGADPPEDWDGITRLRTKV